MGSIKSDPIRFSQNPWFMRRKIFLKTNLETDFSNPISKPPPIPLPRIVNRHHKAQSLYFPYQKAQKSIRKLPQIYSPYDKAHISQLKFRISKPQNKVSLYPLYVL